MLTVVTKKKSQILEFKIEYNLISVYRAFLLNKIQSKNEALKYFHKCMRNS